MKSNWTLDIILLAIDSFDLNEIAELFEDESKFFDRYLFDEPNEYLSIESARYDSVENILLLAKFLFGEYIISSKIFRFGEITIFDLSEIKSKITTFEELENWYVYWIKESKRENSMDEYGQLIGIISYVQRHQSRKHLLLIVQPINEK